MQTFLPYSDLYLTAACLDYKRLGKQRVEAKQILNVLLGRAKINSRGNVAWSNHPAVKMWKGYEVLLSHYHNVMIEEWIRRGFKNSMTLENLPGELIIPLWFGDPKFHSSHRANLLRKDFGYYSQFGWEEKSSSVYYWPIN
jgi:hypothetical protein